MDAQTILSLIQDRTDDKRVFNLSYHEIQLLGSKVVIDNLRPEVKENLGRIWCQTIEQATGLKPLVATLHETYTLNAIMYRLENIFKGYARNEICTYEGERYVPVSADYYLSADDLTTRDPLDVSKNLSNNNIGEYGIDYTGKSIRFREVLLRARYKTHEIDLHTRASVASFKISARMIPTFQLSDLADFYSEAYAEMVREKGDPYARYSSLVEEVLSGSTKDFSQGTESFSQRLDPNIIPGGSDRIFYEQKLSSWKLSSELLKRLENARIIETDAARIFSLEKQIENAKADLSDWEKELRPYEERYRR